VKAAFDIGAMIRWLDFNDTGSRPSGSSRPITSGGILATGRLALPHRGGERQEAAHHARRAHRHDQGARGSKAASRSRTRSTRSASTMSCWSRSPRRPSSPHARAFPRRDHQRAVARLGRRGSRSAPTGTRRTPARARAGRPATPTSRAVRLALIAKTGEMGYPSVLSAKGWGFYDVLFKGNEFKFQRPYGSYVMGERALQDLVPRGIFTRRRRSKRP